MKRFLFAVLSLVLFISLLSIPANASSASDLASAADSVVGKSYSDLGLPSSNWCGYFVGYCINNSSVSSLAGEQISRPSSANAMTLTNWICAIKNIGTYYSLSSPHYDRLTNAYKNLSIASSSVSEFEPTAGDIVVFDWNGRGDDEHVFSHVGIVTAYDGYSAKVTYVDGNSGTGTNVNRKITSRTYDAIIGYIRLKEGQTSTTPLPSTPPTAPVYADCNVEIACFNGQTVNLYNNPGDTSRVTYFSKGQTARSAYCATLSDGSIWYRVSAYHNGADRTFWLKNESNKMTVTCRSHTYDAEKCTICGAVLNYDNAFDASAAGTYQVTASTAYVRTGPYQVKDLVRTINNGETMHVTGSVINSNGNTWLKTSEGYYIHAEKLSKVVSDWGTWSDWSATPVSSSSTREVETRQVLLTEGHTEYRYGRYVDSAGKHDCWCSRYLEGLKGVTGSAILDYSDWSTTQYSPARPYWTCGFCKGNHANVDHYTADGRAWWRQYILSGESYYWEETRTVDAVYETQYRYRDLVN